MSVCHLSEEETRAFENYDIQPNCSHHRHLSFKEAAKLFNAQQVRPVGDTKGLCAVVNQLSNDREWRKTMSGGEACMQLVRIVGGVRIGDGQTA
jgi:hypothetical protein